MAKRLRRGKKEEGMSLLIEFVAMIVVIVSCTAVIEDMADLWCIRRLIKQWELQVSGQVYCRRLSIIAASCAVLLGAGIYAVGHLLI